ncbi:hypothetical protein ACWDYK_39255 [Streptomyces anthocyanicus]|uniref:hypothetical protein n=1 Tax=Streptomyces anthocyanicus TaxID=68174 RepID=UPI002F9083DD|nr:hypothetical protein OHA15_39315 [Streptomyces anthocyanicus]
MVRILAAEVMALAEGIARTDALIQARFRDTRTLRRSSVPAAGRAVGRRPQGVKPATAR